MARLIWVFVRRWWAYMSCAVWTLLSIWQLIYKKNDKQFIVINMVVAAVFLVIAVTMTAFEQYQKRREIERQLEEAINKDRPEVFITLSFGRVGARSVGLQNCGVRDARNVQVQPLHLRGVNRGREETKELIFPQIPRLPNSEEPQFPPVRLNNFIDLEGGVDMGIYLRAWCDNWEKDSLEFEMSVQWFDSSGNEFGSTSKMIYSREEQTCRTITGFVRLVRPTD
jgi:hypothetical protein